MTAELIDGKAFAANLREKVGEHAAAFAEKAGRKAGLAVVLVGADAASEVYVLTSSSRNVLQESADAIERSPRDESRAQWEPLTRHRLHEAVS